MINYNALGIKSQRGKTLSLRLSCVNIARKNAPIDTGNLMYRGIYSMATRNGFKVVWDSRSAYYLPFVNEGKNPFAPNSPKVIRNKGFVDRGFMEIFKFLQSYCNGENVFNLDKQDRKIKLALPDTSDFGGARCARNFKKSVDYYRKGYESGKFTEDDIIDYSSMVIRNKQGDFTDILNFDLPKNEIVKS